MRTHLRLAFLAAFVGAPATTAHPAVAQTTPAAFEPHGEWLTLETERFRVHFPAEAEAWTLDLARRLESMGEEVADEVGRDPDARTTVVVADPTGRAGGYAIPLLNRPLTTLWPTPPEPGTRIGEYRDWGELLFIHEYVHLAHLSFPRRDRWRHAARHLLPVRLGPVSLRTPRWAVEGYATHLEGKLTGAGRPHGASLPAFARQRALDGGLPTYGQLSGGQGFEDGHSPYLLGAAFIQWLVEREGEESLEHLWRRLSARERRSFSEAFSGVYRGPPDELYGEFTVDLTERALEARDLLEEAGVEKGELRTLRRWATGAPAMSPDGELLAVTLFERDRPGRLVVEATETDQEAVREAEERREELLERDPEDVPAVDWRPPPRETLAELEPFLGRAHHSPRFLPGGDEILVIRSEPLADGVRTRSDLFIWDFRNDDLRRVTRGGGIRQADPSPDGSEAVGARCQWGRCDLVRVDLESGEVSPVADAPPGGGYYGPRWAPDGEWIVASVRDEGGRWRLAAVPLGDGASAREGFLDPDDGAHRYDPAFLPTGELVTVSTLGGVPNLELLDPDTGETRPLTRVLGEAAAPAPGPEGEGVHFLHRHSRGWDVRRVHPDRVDLDQVVELPEELWPAAPAGPAEPPPPYAPRDVPEPEAYGWGSHGLAPLAGLGLHEAGWALQLGLSSSDPIGRAGLLAQAHLANPRVWAGASAGGVVRRIRFPVRGELFAARRRPSGEDQRTGPLDVRLTGGTASVEAETEGSRSRVGARLGTSLARLAGAEDTFSRASAGAQARVSAARDGTVRLQPHASLGVSAGRTARTGWTRIRTGLGVAVGAGDATLRLRGAYGRLDGGPELERFRVGGEETTLFDPAVLDQEEPEPVFPTALLGGDRLGSAAVELDVGGAHAFLRLWSTDEDLSEWARVAGLEHEIRVGPFPEVAIPSLRARVGIAHSFDDPFRDRTRAYLSLGFRP